MKTVSKRTGNDVKAYRTFMVFVITVIPTILKPSFGADRYLQQVQMDSQESKSNKSAQLKTTSNYLQLKAPDNQNEKTIAQAIESTPEEALNQEENGSSEFDVKEESQGLSLTGLLRNDAIVVKTSEGDNYQFYNILENRLIFESKRADWKYYADARAFVYGGEASTLYGENKVDLMRAFIRYFSPIGDFTVGKTYVNFGNPGVFNPFEFDKSVQFTDLSYARQGLLAIEHYVPWQDHSGVKTYIGNTTPGELMWGVSPSIHAGTFNIGLVNNRTAPNKNTSGAYFKGDAFVGVQGSWAAHWDDAYNYEYSEGSGGVDYSFFDGDLIASALYYYNGIGALSVSDYSPQTDSFLLARHYTFATLNWSIDEFTSLQLASFINLTDYSAAIIPSFTTILSSGLSLTLQLAYFTADGNEEFSKTRAGVFSTMLRVEGKF